MEINLSSKTALVTGGAGGIGRACVRALAQAGARVAVADINLPGAQEAVAPYAGGLALRCDLGDPQDISALCRNLLEQSGVVDIIVNCAGIVSFKRGIQSLTAEEWDLVLNVNLRAPFLICRELVEPMKARRSGKIINFSSMAGRAGGLEAGLHYSVSKAGLIGLTKSLAKELGPYGICVNAVAPGFTETEAVKQQLRGKADRYIAQIPLGRLGQPADVAEVVLFLASPMSDYLTGLVIDINGGMYTG
jgi:3-oxoacyl-[acyl-carrier protein] reductase